MAPTLNGSAESVMDADAPDGDCNVARARTLAFNRRFATIHSLGEGSC
jgi:hypothetical protein